MPASRNGRPTHGAPKSARTLAAITADRIRTVDTGASGPFVIGTFAKFWCLPRVEPAGGICASEPEVARDPECDCREAEAPLQGRFQGPALRGGAHPAGGLVVSALPAQLSRHRGAVSGARLGGRPRHPEPLGAGLRAPDRAPAASLPQTPLRLGAHRRDIREGPRPVAV